MAFGGVKLPWNKGDGARQRRQRVECVGCTPVFASRVLLIRSGFSASGAPYDQGSTISVDTWDTCMRAPTRISGGSRSHSCRCINRIWGRSLELRRGLQRRLGPTRVAAAQPHTRLQQVHPESRPESAWPSPKPGSGPNTMHTTSCPNADKRQDRSKEALTDHLCHRLRKPRPLLLLTVYWPTRCTEGMPVT